MTNIPQEKTTQESERQERAILDALQKHRAVILGDIDEKSVGEVSRRLIQLQLESPKPVKLLINSLGGGRLPAMALHDLIRHGLTMPVHALVMGKCYSAATFILLACKIRRSMPHGRFIIHSGSMNNITLRQDGMTEENVARLSAEIRKDTEELITLYQKGLKKPRGVIKKLIAQGDKAHDNQLSAEEALGIGLITEIVSGDAGIFPVPLEEA